MRERQNADSFFAELMGWRPAARARGREGEGEDAALEGAPIESVPSFPTLRQVWNADRRQLVFSFKPITTTFTDGGNTFKGMFWVTSDAVKYKIPASETALLAEWNRWKHADPIDADGDMLCRLPCTAKQCQALADVLTTHPDPVRSGAEDGLINHTAPIRDDMRPQPCLLLTPYLYSRRYQQVSCKIDPVGRDTNPTIMVAEAAKHNQYINQQIEAFMRARGDSYRVPSVGDPGKIWAISNEMYVRRAKNGQPSAINYGWHGPTAGSHAVVPGLKLIQSIGTTHDDTHIDYSQVCVLVSGWCEITEPGDTAPKWMRTEEVYTSRRLCRLVTHDGVPLARTRYNT